MSFYKEEIHMSIGKVFLIFIMLCFIGCGGGTWVHEDKSKNVDVDKKECQSEAQRKANEKLYDPNHPKGHSAWRYAFKQNLKLFYENCMTEKGWKPE